MVQKIYGFARSHATAFIVLTLFMAGIAVYAHSFSNGMFWDDYDGILHNQYVHDFHIGRFFSENLIAGAGLESNYWRPTLLIIYSIQWKLWETWAPGFHFTNFLIHYMNALLVFFLLKRMVNARTWLIFLVSLVFLVHPLQTEAVTYVSGLGDPVSFFFILIGIYAYYEYRKKNHKGTFFFFLALISFLLALLSKERSVIFPAFLLLAELWCFIKKERNTEYRLQESIFSILPFFLIAGIYLLLRGTVLNFENTFNIYNSENYYTSHIFARVFTFFSVIPEYLSLLVFPKTLFMERTENVAVVTSLFHIKTLIGICITLIASFFAVIRFKKKPEYSFALLFFAIALFPASGIFVPVAGIIFEHYMYAPIVGFFLFFAAGMDELWNLEKVARWIKIVGITLLGAWIIAIGARTVIRNEDWKDAITFYEQTLRHAPKSLRVWNNLGMAYAENGSYRDALYAYGRAIALDPENPIPYHNSGNVYEELRDRERAEEYWRMALTADPHFIPSLVKISSAP